MRDIRVDPLRLVSKQMLAGRDSFKVGALISVENNLGDL